MQQATTIRQVISVSIIAAFALVSVAIAIKPVFAQTQNNQAQTVVEACQELENKIQEIVDGFHQKRDTHLKNYYEISGLFSSIIYQLNSQEYDTAILKELQPGLERRIAHFSDMSGSFISELEDVRDSACRDKDSFNQELEEARESLKDVQISVTEVQNHVQQILLPAVKNVVNNGGGA